MRRIAATLAVVGALLFCTGSAWADWVEQSHKRAEQGNAGAQNVLGMKYVIGDHVPKDHVKTYMWFLLAKA